MALGALSLAHETRVRQAAASQAGHALAAGAAALAAAADSGAPLEPAAAALRPLAGQDAVVGAVVEALPAGTVPTRWVVDGGLLMGTGYIAFGLRSWREATGSRCCRYCRVYISRRCPLCRRAGEDSMMRHDGVVKGGWSVRQASTGYGAVGVGECVCVAGQPGSRP